MVASAYDCVMCSRTCCARCCAWWASKSPFPDAALQRTDDFWLREHRRIDHLAALLSDDGLQPRRADLYDITLGQGAGVKVVRRALPSIVEDRVRQRRARDRTDATARAQNAAPDLLSHHIDLL